jgi:hypothetical protein
LKSDAAVAVATSKARTAITVRIMTLVMSLLLFVRNLSVFRTFGWFLRYTPDNAGAPMAVPAAPVARPIPQPHASRQPPPWVKSANPKFHQ